KRVLPLKWVSVFVSHPESWIGEDDGPIRRADHIVRLVQPPGSEAIRENFDAAVRPGRRHSTTSAGNQSALTIVRVAVGAIRRIAEDVHTSGVRPPIQDLLPHVAECEVMLS